MGTYSFYLAESTSLDDLLTKSGRPQIIRVEIGDILAIPIKQSWAALDSMN